MEEAKYIVVYVPVLALDTDRQTNEESNGWHKVAEQAIIRTRNSIRSQLEPTDKLFVIPVKRDRSPSMEMLYPMDPAKRELMEARFIEFDKELLNWLTAQEILATPIHKPEFKAAIAEPKPKFLSRKWFLSKLPWNRD